MNKKTYMVVFGAAVLLAACASGGTGAGGTAEMSGSAEKNGAVAMSGTAEKPAAVFTRNERVPFDAANPDGPALVFSLSLPRDEGPYARALSQMLYDGKTCEDYAQARFAACKAKYFDAISSITLDAPPDASTARWDYIEKSTLTTYGFIAVMERTRYMYEGGANGVEETEDFVYDTKDNRQVLLTDLIPEANLAELTERAKRALSERGIAVPELRISQNFRVSPEGLSFLWQPATIAPHSDGLITAALSLRAIEPLLSDYGKTVFAAVERPHQAAQ